MLKKKEIFKILGFIKSPNLSALPLLLYFNNKGFLKAKIGVGQGKKKYDKREVEKKKTWERKKQDLVRNS